MDSDIHQYLDAPVCPGSCDRTGHPPCVHPFDWMYGFVRPAPGWAISIVPTKAPTPPKDCQAMGLIHHAIKREPPCPLPVSGRDASANNTLVLTHRNTSPSPPSPPSCPRRLEPRWVSSNLVFVGPYVCKLGNTGRDEVVIQSPTPGECLLGASPCAPRSYSACLEVHQRVE